MSDEEAKRVIDNTRLIVKTRGFENKILADVLLRGSDHFFSPAMKTLIEDIEPGVQRYFEIRAISKVPIGGKTDHGIYYWLRPPPVIDCLLFPPSWTLADFHGKAWDKTPRYFEPHAIPQQWGGGLAASKPAYIDAKKIEGRHFWLTRLGPDGRIPTHLLTWSQALMTEYRKRKLSGWRIDRDLHIVG